MKHLFVVDSEVARQAVQVGRNNHQRFRPVRLAEPINEPFYENEWWYIPLAEEIGHVPKTALANIELLRREGFAVEQVIVAHETPKLLPPPAGESAKEKREARLREMGEEAVGFLGQATRLAVEIGVEAAMFLVEAMSVLGVVFVGLVGFALMIDPAVIAIVKTEDGRHVWIEVAMWYD